MNSASSAIKSPPAGPENVAQSPPQREEDLPKPSEEAMRFLDALQEKEVKSVLYSDSLVTLSETGKVVGSFNIVVTPARHQGADCFKVEAISHGVIDGVPCGTSILTYVTTSLETLEQHHHEYIKLANHPLDRKTSLVKDEGKYNVSQTTMQGENKKETSRTFSWDAMQGFISEGANLLLQRLLIRKTLPGNFALLSLDADARLCSVSYLSLETKLQTIQDKQVDVRGIERKLLSTVDNVTWHVYCLSDGHLASWTQVGSPVTMLLRTLPAASAMDEYDEKPVFPKQQLDWEDDIQLKSIFLDRKEQLKADHSTFLREHPEVQAMLSDFIQLLLLRKPDDVLDFAASYFASFSAKSAPEPTFLRSREGTMS